MTQINKFLRRALSLFKAHAEYSQKTAADFSILAMEVEDILSNLETPDNPENLETPDNQVNELEIYDSDVEIFEFNEAISSLQAIVAEQVQHWTKQGTETSSLVQLPCQLNPYDNDVQELKIFNCEPLSNEFEAMIDYYAVGQNGHEIVINESDG